MEETMSGRKDEAILFNGFANATASRQPGLMMIRAVSGIGKTSTIKQFMAIAEKNGLVAPYVKVERGESPAAVAERLFHEAAISPGFVKKKAAVASFSELMDGSGFDSQHFGIVFFIDDIDNMKKADRIVGEIENIVKESWKKKAVSFVVSSTRKLKKISDSTISMELGTFTEQEARAYVEKALKDKKIRMGEECLNSIMADSDGNQKLFKAVCRIIYDRLRDDERIMTKGHYLAYLPHIMSMLSREWFGRMYQETPPAERRILLTLAQGETRHVSDIAKELGKPLGPVTALIKRLLDRGQIMKLERGQYKIFSRLYGKYVIERS